MVFLQQTIFRENFKNFTQHAQRTGCVCCALHVTVYVQQCLERHEAHMLINTIKDLKKIFIEFLIKRLMLFVFLSTLIQAQIF
jgi:hypothetical protein